MVPQASPAGRRVLISYYPLLRFNLSNYSVQPNAFHRQIAQLSQRDFAVMSRSSIQPILLFCHRRRRGKTSIVTTLLQIGGGLVDTLLPLGQLFQGLEQSGVSACSPSIISPYRCVRVLIRIWSERIIFSSASLSTSGVLVGLAGGRLLAGRRAFLFQIFDRLLERGDRFFQRGDDVLLQCLA